MPEHGPAFVDNVSCAAKAEAMPRWDVRPVTGGRVQIDYNGARTEAIWTLKGSLDGVNFYAFSPTVTLTDDGMTALLDLTGIAYLQADLTALETTNTALRGKLTFFGQWE